MRYYKDSNGSIISTIGKIDLEEITEEEYREINEATAKKIQFATKLQKLPTMTETEVSRLLIAQQINTLDVDDNTALRMLEFYPAWDAGKSYTAGYKVQHGEKLWRCVQAHTSQSGWEPSTATASLWEQINESHGGTLDDPIPYDGNMALEAGKYYYQDYTIYLCNRDTVNQVYNPMAELVGIYVEAV